MQGTDAECLRALQDGDAAGFDALFARHRRGVRAYAQTILRDAALAEDVTQACFLELVRRAGELETRQRVAGWLYRVARNRAIDLQRHRRFDVLAGDAVVAAAREQEDVAPSAADVVMNDERGRDVMMALDQLPENERDVLMLRYFSGLAFRDVAVAVGRPLGTVLWQAQRGLRRMRGLLLDRQA